MGPRLLALAVVVAGCGAELDENAPADARSDGASDNLVLDGGTDAPIDARPCTGGDQRAPDPSTGTCLVYVTGPATYVNAEAACAAMGGHLVVIKSAQTNANVLSLVGLTDAFIGAHDRDAEGTFRWLGAASDPVTGGYTNWRTGEPSSGGGTYEEDCALIEGARNGTWDDRPCAPPPVGAGAYAYVCQY